MKASEGALASTSGLPDKIGRYRIVDRVGKGAMGIVYSAVDEMMDRPVAVKVMMADLEGEPETKARFYREAQAAARLVHPNIITIFDVGESEGRSFMVMELLNGCPLPDHLKLPDVGLERKLDLMIQLCEALSVAHTGGVFHRDIKPGNIFVQHDGLLKVLDFGIARLANSNMTTSGFIVGTPDYMSPEQARGRTVDCRSDIFSAGGVFYFILTGRKPFAAADLPAVLHKVEREDPLPLRESEAPVPLARVVAKALAKEPERRYQQCQDLLTDLLRFKRFYENETRRMAEGARALYQGIESLLVSTAAAERQLGMQASATTSPVIDALSARYPLFADRRAEAFAAFPFERARIVAISSELGAEQERLMTLSGAILTAQSAVEAGDAALAAGDAGVALKFYERATQVLPSCARAQDALARTRDEVTRLELRDEQIRALLHEAAAASQAASWSVVIALSDRVLALSAAEPQAVALRRKAVAAIEHEEQQRLQALQRAIDQFDRALEASRLKDAEQHLQHASSLCTDPTRATEMTQRFEQACAAAAEAEARAARDAAEAARVHAEELAKRQAQAAVLVEQAEAALGRNDAAAAANHAEAALAIDGASVRATQALAAARVGLEQAALATARAAKVAQHIRAGREQLERGNFSRASREARAALDADPADEAAAALVAEVVEREEAAAAARARAEAAAQRRKAAAPALSAARKAMRARDYERAGWAAENALALCPDSDEARDVLDQARAAIAAQTPADTEETVDGSSVAPKTDETVSLTASTPVARAVDHVGQLANGFWKKIQSNRGQVMTEWVMIAGLFVGITVFLISIFPEALTQFVRSLAMSMRTVAP